MICGRIFLGTRNLWEILHRKSYSVGSNALLLCGSKRFAILLGVLQQFGSLGKLLVVAQRVLQRAAVEVVSRHDVVGDEIGRAHV